MSIKKEAMLLVLLALVTAGLSESTKILDEVQQRKLISVDYNDTTRPFPRWLQIVYFIICCLMVLGGIAACVMCGASKAGYADVSMNVPGGATGGNVPGNYPPMSPRNGQGYYPPQSPRNNMGQPLPGGGMGQAPNASMNQSMNNSQMPLNGNRGY